MLFFWCFNYVQVHRRADPCWPAIRNGYKLSDGDHIYCLSMIQSLPTLTKTGPWGGHGGSVTESEQPWRIESMTIVHEGIIAMFSCSYVDLSGKRRTTGSWGGGNGIRTKVCFSSFFKFWFWDY